MKEVEHAVREDNDLAAGAQVLHEGNCLLGGEDARDTPEFDPHT